MVSFHPLTPWTLDVRYQIEQIAAGMADMDALEIFGLRPLDHDGENVVSDIAQIIRNGALIDGFVATRDVDGAAVPFAVALAFRGTMPNVADLAMFGRKGHARAMPAVYRELFSRSITFGPRHDIKMAQVPVLAKHRAARRMLRSVGGREVFDYGPIGPYRLSYIHTIWSF